MTPRARVLRALAGDHGDCVPFTVYECMIPQCVTERNLRNRGMCIVNRVKVFETHRPDVKVTREVYWEDGKQFTRTYHRTPVGTVSTLDEAAGFTSWSHEKMFKTPDDYKTLLFMIQNERHEPAYDAFARAERDFGEDGIFRAGLGSEPLQGLISGGTFAMEDFCLQWMDNRDEVLKLYRAVVENRRKIYPLVAHSPALFANYGGNVVAEIVGPQMFEQYFAPHYDEAAEAMHKQGKYVGCHFDGNCRLLAPAIARTGLDYIEAFTPAPDTDMTLAEARAAWPKKTLWLNFPSSVHLKSDAEVEQATVGLLEELNCVDGLIMGITEDMPPDRWRHSCTAIVDGLARHAQERSALYRNPRKGNHGKES